MKAKHAALVQALTGMFSDHHGELAQLLLDQIAFLEARIARLNILINEHLASIPAAWGAGTSAGAIALPAVARLDEITGISAGLATAIIAKTGLDMTRFPAPGHLVSWAGLTSRTIQSGPRTRNAKGQGNTYLRGYLCQAATGAARTNTFPGERYRRIARRRGPAKAQVAIARSILVIIWHLLADPTARYADLGPGYYQTKTSK